MPWTPEEIVETLRMTETEHLDIRTVTLSLSLLDCRDDRPSVCCRKIRDKLLTYGSTLATHARAVSAEYGLPIANRRMAVTPIAIVGDGLNAEGFLEIARTLDETAAELGVDFVGGYSALVPKGFTHGDRTLISTIPQALAITQRVCSSVNVATTKAGMNMDAVRLMAETILATAAATADRGGIGCAKLVVFCNVPEDNPFMAGAFHGVTEPEVCLNVGISGPGVVLEAIRRAGDCDLAQLSDVIKRTAFKVTRMGELVGRTMSARMGLPFGIVDLSLAPTPAWGDSVAEVLEAMGLERVGAPGTTAALMMLTDAVKKGGSMASGHVGGMSGAFIPVSEDAGMIRAVREGALTIEKLEAMTSVCCVGLDMVAVPGDTSADTLSGLIADEMAIGMVNNKTTAVRVIPVPGAKVGDLIEFGGLLGTAPIMPISTLSQAAFIHRGGRVPATVRALSN